MTKQEEQELQIYENEKLYIVTRNDLTLQYQLPQTIHAAIQFANDFPAEQRKWFLNSNTIVALAAKDLFELESFVGKAVSRGHKISKFYEPDIGNELTAVAIVPDPRNKKLCSKFKLAGK